MLAVGGVPNACALKGMAASGMPAPCYFGGWNNQRDSSRDAAGMMT